MKSKKQILNFLSLEQMQDHAREERLLLICYKNSVYDLSDFIYEHPGGCETIQQFTNQSVDQIIFNQKFHKHSAQIITKLQDYLYAYIIKTDNEIIPRNLNVYSIKSEKCISDNQPQKKKINVALKFLREDAETKLSSLDIPKIGYKKGKSEDGGSETEHVPDDTDSSIKVPQFHYRFKSTNQLD